ncbi:hypothetical protein AAKU61_002315 [Undibacterium sp. GrIS 1.2]
MATASTHLSQTESLASHSQRMSPVGKTTPNPSYMAPPKYKKLINSSGARNKPAVDYPASDVESIVFHADMESA